MHIFRNFGSLNFCTVFFHLRHGRRRERENTGGSKSGVWDPLAHFEVEGGRNFGSGYVSQNSRLCHVLSFSVVPSVSVESAMESVMLSYFWHQTAFLIGRGSKIFHPNVEFSPSFFRQLIGTAKSGCPERWRKREGRNFAGTLDVPQSWISKELVWKIKVPSWRKVRFSGFTDDSAIQGNRSPSLYKCQCFESWNSENVERKRNHALQCGYFKHRTLVLNPSFCESSQHLRSSFELVWTVRLDRGRKGTREATRIRDQRCINMCEITRSKTFGIPSKTCIWKELARKHSWFRIAGRENSIHKGLRTCIVQTQSISWEEIQNSTWRQLIPFCREHTLSQAHPQSRNFAAIPGGTIIGPVIEVKTVKLLNNMDLKLQIHHPKIMYGQLMLWIPEGRVGSWMKSIFLMPDSDPVRSYSLNFKDQKEESRAKNRPILASRRLVQPMFQILPATRKLAQTLSAFLLHKRFFKQKEPFVRTMGNGRLFMPILQTEETWQ